jgi:hypothetical protein
MFCFLVEAQIIELDQNCGKSVAFENEKSILGASTSKEGQAGWQVKYQ